MHNGKYQCHVAASCVYHLSALIFSKSHTQKSLSLNEKCWRIFWRKIEKNKKGRENGQSAEK